jgi:hypothetical protein
VTDELDRLGAQARAAAGLRPRLPVAQIEYRGRRRRNRHRALGATAAVAAIAVIVAGGELFAGGAEPTTDIGGGAGTSAPAPPPPPTTPVTTAAITTPETTPEPDPSGGTAGAPVALTVLPPLGARQALPSAILTGTLLMEDHCVFLRLDDGQRDLVVWKDGTRLDTSGEVPVVIAPDGSVIGAAGDRVSLVGGETPPDALEDLGVVGLRRACVTPKIVYTSGPS